MICPRCNGKGRITKPAEAKRAADSFAFVLCDYPGCVDGTVQCCEGDQEQPTKSWRDFTVSRYTVNPVTVSAFTFTFPDDDEADSPPFQGH